MGKFASDPLGDVKIASPCQADWNEMYGDERKRFCAHCRLNVYNLSAMSRGEAERLVASAEGRLCVRFYRRADGTILTQDCPVGVAAIRAKVRRVATAAASFALSFLAGVGITLGLREKPAERRASPGIAAPERVDPQPPPIEMGQPMQGAIAVSPNEVPPRRRR